MSPDAFGLRANIVQFLRREGISAEMEQNLIKETIHLYLLSALSDSGILDHVVFQGGTALRLCYGGERYSEDLDFVCGKAGSYLAAIAFEDLVRTALEATRDSLRRSFAIEPHQITVRQPARPAAIRGASTAVAAWQIAVPIATTPHAPRSRIKVEFANVPSYDNKPMLARSTPGLAQIQDVILRVETSHEILADKAVALTARPRPKYRDLWDVWYLKGKLGATIDRDMVKKKFNDYATEDIEAKASRRIDDLLSAPTAEAFLQEMKRFLPAKRVGEMMALGLQHTIVAEARDLIRSAVLPA